MLRDQSQPRPASNEPAAAEAAGATADLSARGFGLLRAPAMEALLEPYGADDWAGFAQSWDDLGADRFMADGGRYRKRRFCAFAAGAREVRRKPHQPHYQSRDFNPLNGGVSRWFDPVTEAIAAHPTTLAILRACASLFTDATPPELRPAAWHVELHQFRVEARTGEHGQPTPEGMHQDGVDWVLVMLVRRQNIASGITSIGTADREPLGSFTLAEPRDACVLDDARVCHGVTAIRPIDPHAPAFRDVLVVTFRRE